jgi:hypothetical protein
MDDLGRPLTRTRSFDRGRDLDVNIGEAFEIALGMARRNARDARSGRARIRPPARDDASWPRIWDMETSPEQKLQTEMQTGFTVPLLSQANFLKSLVVCAVPCEPVSASQSLLFPVIRIFSGTRIPAFAVGGCFSA